MNAFVRTTRGCWLVDLETEELLEAAEDDVSAPDVHVSLPRVVAAAASGSTVVAVVDRRPPLAVSYDAGRTWHESGGGLPKGTAIAIDAENPDRILYAARNRLFLSEDGGRFWRALVVELPEIEAIAFA
ncbi:MAG: hypothetical protein E6G50_14415 [Actinobacteria bacterium]|jgi:hypothetical protein|nr:MAG: hypothetical protein E6G50_14415 [Actinomycetota bacterium]